MNEEKEALALSGTLKAGASEFGPDAGGVVPPDWRITAAAPKSAAAQ
jgi:hypothetical protein